jgi:flagellar basal body-associated protein FliL
MVQPSVMSAASGKSAGQKKRSGILYLLIFVFLAVIIIIVGILLYLNYKSQFRAETESQLSSIVELKVNELANWRRARMNDGLVFYRNSVFTWL